MGRKTNGNGTSYSGTGTKPAESAKESSNGRPRSDKPYRGGYRGDAKSGKRTNFNAPDVLARTFLRFQLPEVPSLGQPTDWKVAGQPTESVLFVGVDTSVNLASAEWRLNWDTLAMNINSLLNTSEQSLITGTHLRSYHEILNNYLAMYHTCMTRLETLTSIVQQTPQFQETRTYFEHLTVATSGVVPSPSPVWTSENLASIRFNLDRLAALLSTFPVLTTLEDDIAYRFRNVFSCSPDKKGPYLCFRERIALSSSSSGLLGLVSNEHVLFLIQQLEIPVDGLLHDANFQRVARALTRAMESTILTNQLSSKPHRLTVSLKSAEILYDREILCSLANATVAGAGIKYTNVQSAERIIHWGDWYWDIFDTPDAEPRLWGTGRTARIVRFPDETRSFSGLLKMLASTEFYVGKPAPGIGLNQRVQCMYPILASSYALRSGFVPTAAAIGYEYNPVDRFMLGISWETPFNTSHAVATAAYWLAVHTMREGMAEALNLASPLVSANSGACFNTGKGTNNPDPTSEYWSAITPVGLRALSLYSSRYYGSIKQDI